MTPRVFAILSLLSPLALASCGDERDPGGAAADDPGEACDDAALDGEGVCRREDGTFAPASCCGDVAAAGRTATIACDFGKEATEGFAIGALTFAVDLDDSVVKTRCPSSTTCILDGTAQELELVAQTAWDPDQPAGFPRAAEEGNVRQLIISGSNGDDIELTAYVSVFPERIDEEDAEAVLIINDGQFINGVSGVARGCTVKVE
jgi:hypothetical protein